MRPITDACSVNGATELQIGACAHTKLLAAWPDAQPGAKECAGLVGSRPTAACLLDFGYWNYVSGLIGQPMRGNWATFDLNDNDLWVHWFEKTHKVCDPSGTVSDGSFYACARNEAKRFLSMTDEVLDGCPERQDPTLAVICYWDGSFNKYVLTQLERLDG
ncbi:MAG: hypothetical protein IPK59_18170 [Rhodospirillaceae bacterium]|nr:hypothetical protein [Rhodospirillaceae bacterium]